MFVRLRQNWRKHGHQGHFHITQIYLMTCWLQLLLSVILWLPPSFWFLLFFTLPLAGLWIAIRYTSFRILRRVLEIWAKFRFLVWSSQYIWLVGCNFPSVWASSYGSIDNLQDKRLYFLSCVGHYIFFLCCSIAGRKAFQQLKTGPCIASNAEEWWYCRHWMSRCLILKVKVACGHTSTTVYLQHCLCHN